MNRFTALCLTSLMSLCWSLSASALQAGEPGFDFNLPSLSRDGSHQRLSDFRGKVVYLDFWASWCGPCRKSLPQLAHLQQQLSDQAFVVLGVNLDDDPALGRRFLDELGVSFPNVSDTSGSSYDTFGLVGMPTSYLIDQQGMVRWVHQGFADGDIAVIRQHVDALLQSNP